MNINPFSGLSKAQIFERGQWFDAGFKGRVKITKCLVKDTRKNGLAFLVETEILTSEDPTKGAVGDKRTWMQTFKQKDSAFGAIKEFCYAILGFDKKNAAQLKEAEATVAPQIEALLGEVCDEKVQAFANKELNLFTWHKQTEKGGNFTVHDWSPV